VTITFEINAHRAKFPENEQYTERGQWGPYKRGSLYFGRKFFQYRLTNVKLQGNIQLAKIYIVRILVFAATLMARIRGWDFDTKGTDGQNRGFQWLLTGDSSTDESEERLLMQSDPEPPIQLQALHIGTSS
jgi:hypothetical protein